MLRKLTIEPYKRKSDFFLDFISFIIAVILLYLIYAIGLPLVIIGVFCQLVSDFNHNVGSTVENKFLRYLLMFIITILSLVLAIFFQYLLLLYFLISFWPSAIRFFIWINTLIILIMENYIIISTKAFSMLFFWLEQKFLCIKLFTIL